MRNDRSPGGRPRLSEGPTVQLGVRVPETTKRRLEQRAAARGVDLSTYLRQLYDQALADE